MIWTQDLGNFVINDFEDAQKAYQEANTRVMLGELGIFGEEKDLKKLKEDMRLKFQELADVREDDAWKVSLALANNKNKRSISGNVWEAISDDVKNSLGLQGNNTYMKYDGKDQNLNLEGIKVELVELVKDKDKNDTQNGGQTQIVRASAVTDEFGNYEFTNFIPGDYCIRFIYGEPGADGTVLRSEVSKYATKKDEGDKLPINGQYYQSTKANPNTDNDPYWYKEASMNETTLTKEVVDETYTDRYSDAYDDAYSRLTQMKSTIEGGADPKHETNTSSNYNLEGVTEVQSTRHTDAIYAYTSTMELEIEYTRKEVTGNSNNSWYEYNINNIDFGLTPRSRANVDIDKYVQNVKMYLTQSGGLEKIVDVSFKQRNDGSLEIDEGKSVIGKDYINASTTEYEKSGTDGLVSIEYNEAMLNGAVLEITYKITVSNDSEYIENGEDKICDTIKYITYNGKTIGVVYYQEGTESLTNFETKRHVNYEVDKVGEVIPSQTFTYHNDINVEEDHSEEKLVSVDTDRVDNKVNRLGKYSRVEGFLEGNVDIIKSKATNIVDFPTSPLEFAYKDIEGHDINQNWVIATKDDFVSAREYDNYLSDSGNKAIETYHNLIRAKDEKDGEKGNLLYSELEPGQTTNDIMGDSNDNLITLTTTLTSTSLDKPSPDTNLKIADYDYWNLVEITRLENTAGKVTDLEEYTFNGKETSEIRSGKDIDDNTTKVPTISTSESDTVQITEPKGLTLIDNTVTSNLIYVLIGLVIFAGGLIIIKKYVLVANKEA